MPPETIPFESKSWQERLAQIMETMRELSTQTDPQEMVHQYYERKRKGSRWESYRQQVSSTRVCNFIPKIN